MNRSNKGFTLIELLVVIAIIGILSSIVLASLNTARGKGADAAIKGNLEGIRVQAEIIYDTNGNYGSDFAFANCAATGGTLFADNVVKGQITSAGNAVSGTGMANGACVSTASAWAVSMPLKTTSLWWCVDSTGASRNVTIAGTDKGIAGTACKPD